MLVCLITAPAATEFQDPEEFGSDAVRSVSGEPQLGTLSLAAVLGCRGDHCCIINLNRVFLSYVSRAGVVRDFVATAADIIAETEAGIYGFGTICSSYPLTIRIAEAVKSRRPGSTVLFGGPQAAEPSAALN